MSPGYAATIPDGSVDKAGAGRLVQRGLQRTVFLAVRAGKLTDLAQVIFRLLAVALFELPQPVILPGPHVARVILQRLLIVRLRKLVIAELAVGVADQVGDVGDVFAVERLQLLDRRGVVVAVVDRGVGGAITLEEFRVVDARALVALLLVFGIGRRRRRRRRVATRGIGLKNRARDQCRRQHRQRQNPDREFGHALLLIAFRRVTSGQIIEPLGPDGMLWPITRPGDRTPEYGPEHRSYRNIPGWRFIHADFDHR